MDLFQENTKLVHFPSTTSRNLSSSSSAFYSANQSPFFSPKSVTFRLSTDEPPRPSTSANITFDVGTHLEPNKLENVSSSTGIPKSPHLGTEPFGRQNKGRAKKVERLLETFSPNRLRSCDVYIGFHGRKPLLLRFTKWLRAELEAQGLTCFVTDRSRCRNTSKHKIVEKAMDESTFGVVILTRKSFRNPYTIEELRFFSGKKNLVPVYFDVSPDDCLARDIIEKRGEVWEKHGGELWLLYGGLEKEWKEAMGALSHADEWKLEAHDGKWRECIIRAITLLALRLGRRSIVDRLSKWREKAEKEEFPFPRNEAFVGRKRELSELEFMLFGDISGEAERDYFELRARPRRKNLTIAWGRSGSVDEKRKGKEHVVWRESDKDIEMHNNDLSQQVEKPKGSLKHVRRRPAKIVYGKGIACVSGESGIGKTELLLEFAYRFHQRYKMVLWIGGESRYIRQNYMSLRSFLEIDSGLEGAAEKGRSKSFEEQEEAAVARIRKELARDIPYLIIIDNLESEKDWWDHKHVMDLLPRFGGETHVIISTRLSRVMNVEPLRLSYLSGVEAMSLMQGGHTKDQSITEIDALRVMEEKLGRLTLGLAIVGSVLSELPISPARLLDTINRTPSRVVTWGGRETHALRRNGVLLQLFEVCFSIFDHADGPGCLATRMALASGWFAPAPIPVSVLALAAQELSEKHPRRRLWRKLLCSLSCGGCSSSWGRKSAAEASSLLVRFNIARACAGEGSVRFGHLVKLYSRKRGINNRSARAMVRAVLSWTPAPARSPEHLWAACFLLLGFGKDPIVVELQVAELLVLVREVVLPLAIRTFVTYTRCRAAVELLRLCTDALEATDQAFVTPVDRWLDKSVACWRPMRTGAQLNPCLWRDLALARASVLEVRAKLMVRGGQFDVGDDLIRKAVFIRTSICGEDHPETVAARETLGKLTRIINNSIQNHTSP
ncbi:Disease resistance protein (TIR-NBS class [Striga hermonthica]|uniref:Disease resistance protein (TIR-NBS class) n=1 Tax=Striga hermonthica TaxID=68872 RepID=A0A9N7R3S5_STRHE|nr:Disease resistance protein (TIR-NBS class [Striga hermonthica]